MPVIMLTAKSAEDDRVKGLCIGADDYVIKPFSVRELVARVQAHLRRSKKDAKKELFFNKGVLVINTLAQELKKKRYGRSTYEHRVQDTPQSCREAEYHMQPPAADQYSAGV